MVNAHGCDCLVRGDREAELPSHYWAREKSRVEIYIEELRNSNLREAKNRRENLCAALEIRKSLGCDRERLVWRIPCACGDVEAGTCILFLCY